MAIVTINISSGFNKYIITTIAIDETKLDRILRKIPLPSILPSSKGFSNNSLIIIPSNPNVQIEVKYPKCITNYLITP